MPIRPSPPSLVVFSPLLSSLLPVPLHSSLSRLVSSPHLTSPHLTSPLLPSPSLPSSPPTSLVGHGEETSSLRFA
eukprot:754753-Hanusia_phi.AAC.7